NTDHIQSRFSFKGSIPDDTPELSKDRLKWAKLNICHHLILLDQWALPRWQMYRFLVLQRWSFQLKVLSVWSSTQFLKLHRKGEAVSK
ncbi:hypothetical protein AMECASPLE_016319, partial [Ameca splendens]